MFIVVFILTKPLISQWLPPFQYQPNYRTPAVLTIDTAFIIILLLHIFS